MSQRKEFCDPACITSKKLRFGRGAIDRTQNGDMGEQLTTEIIRNIAGNIRKMRFFHIISLHFIISIAPAPPPPEKYITIV